MKYKLIISERLLEEEMTQKIEKSNKRGKNSLVKTIAEADAILAVGGDGHLLHVMREYYDQDKLFVGWHAGTLGFLLNHVTSLDQLPTSLDDAHVITAGMLAIEMKTRDGAIHTAHAINDCIVGKSMIDYFRISVKISGKSEKVEGTGLVLATAIGSTGYALNNGVPLMPLTSDAWCLTGLASRPFHYRFVMPQEISLTIEGKSPCDVGIDGHGHIVHDVVQLIIRPADQHVRIGFAIEQDFQTRRLIMAEQKLGGVVFGA